MIHERDGHTDGQTPHDDTGRAYASHRAAKNVWCSLAVYHCALELYVNRIARLVYLPKYQGGGEDTCPGVRPIAGNANANITRKRLYPSP